MTKFVRLALTAALAVVALTMLSGAASALRSLGTPRQAIRGTSRAVTFAGGGTETICEVTLSGETTTTAVAKRAGAVIGKITSGTTANCRGFANRAVILAEARVFFEVKYTSITGTLPAIISVLTATDGAAFRLDTSLGIMCLYTENNVPSVFSETGGGQTLNQAIFSRARARLREGESGFCPREGTLSGTFTISPTIRVTLL